MAQPSPGASPGVRRRSDGSVRECLFFPVSERNEQERLEAMVRRRAGGAERRGGSGEDQDSVDNRPKRWTWGGPPEGVEGEYTRGGGGGGFLLLPTVVRGERRKTMVVTIGFGLIDVQHSNTNYIDLHRNRFGLEKNMDGFSWIFIIGNDVSTVQHLLRLS